MAQIEKMMDEIKGMTVLELNELVKALEDEFGVSAAAAAPVMMAGAVPGAAAGGEAAEEKTDFDVVLNSPSATRRSTSSRPSVRSPRSVSKRPRSWSRARSRQDQRGRQQGRGRRDQEEVRRGRRPSGDQVTLDTRFGPWQLSASSDDAGRGPSPRVAIGRKGTSMTTSPNGRLSFSKHSSTIPLPNMIQVQRSSYEEFLQMDLLPEERRSAVFSRSCRRSFHSPISARRVSCSSSATRSATGPVAAGVSTDCTISG